MKKHLVCLILMSALIACVPALSEDVPYMVKIPAWASVFGGPGYDNEYVRLVGEDGVYTIVEEALDEEGECWSKLKSGIGWVNLNEIARIQTLPVIVSFADDALMEGGKYHFHPADSSEYAVKIAFRAQTFIRNVRLSELSWDEEFEPFDTVLFGKRYLFSILPLVAELEFSGDMTSYALDFTDESGMDHRYVISISGRNGSLHVREEEKR